MIDKNIISVYILCGGKNKRMGTEKGLVKINGKSFSINSDRDSLSKLSF